MKIISSGNFDAGPLTEECILLFGTGVLMPRASILNFFSPFFLFSGLTIWRRTTDTARGRTMCRSCSGPPSPASSGRSAKTSTIWFVCSPVPNTSQTNRSGKYQMCLCVLQVIILDPVQDYAAELLSVAEMFYTNNIPLRFVFRDSFLIG